MRIRSLTALLRNALPVCSRSNHGSNSMLTHQVLILLLRATGRNVFSLYTETLSSLLKCITFRC